MLVAERRRVCNLPGVGRQSEVPALIIGLRKAVARDFAQKRRRWEREGPREGGRQRHQEALEQRAAGEVSWLNAHGERDCQSSRRGYGEVHFALTNVWTLLHEAAGSSMAPRKKSGEEEDITSGLQLTEQQISEFREAFSLFDKDGDGHVTAKELMIVLSSLGVTPTQEEVSQMIEEVDVNSNGEIEFEEFCVLMVRNMKDKDDLQTFTEAFKILDSDGSGEIDKEELKEMLRAFSRMGEDIPDSEIDAMIREADTDGDGQISYKEFCRVMTVEG